MPAASRLRAVSLVSVNAGRPPGIPGGVVPAGLEARRQQHLVTDLDHDLGVLDEECLGVLPALAELFTLVGEPGAGLLDDAQVD